MSAKRCSAAATRSAAVGGSPRANGSPGAHSRLSGRRWRRRATSISTPRRSRVQRRAVALGPLPLALGVLEGLEGLGLRDMPVAPELLVLCVAAQLGDEVARAHQANVGAARPVPEIRLMAAGLRPNRLLKYCQAVTRTVSTPERTCGLARN